MAAGENHDGSTVMVALATAASGWFFLLLTGDVPDRANVPSSAIATTPATLANAAFLVSLLIIGGIGAAANIRRNARERTIQLAIVAVMVFFAAAAITWVFRAFVLVQSHSLGAFATLVFIVTEAGIGFQLLRRRRAMV